MLLVVYFEQINAFLVWALSLLDTVNRKQCSDIGVGKIKKGSEKGLISCFEEKYSRCCIERDFLKASLSFL